MHISDTCEWTPYGHDFSLDEKLDSCLDNEDKIIGFLKRNKNYGLDKVFNYIQSHSEFKAKYLKSYIIEQGYGLDKFVKDKDLFIREAVAEQGYGLDKLVRDTDWIVRKAVAKQGYGLDKLVNDISADVRSAVNKYLHDHNYRSVFDWAKDSGVDIDIDKWLHSGDLYRRTQVASQGYGIDKLVNDEDWWVRKALAERGYGLDKLINDDDYHVRAAVAEQGYGLDKLISDADRYVRSTVDKYLRDHNYHSVFDWAKDNVVDIDIDEWLHSDNWHQKVQVAKQGYGLDILVNDENLDVRKAVAEQGYGLDKLVNDEDENVRYTVARQGYGLDKLVNDKFVRIRKAVAERGYGLDKLVNDKDWQVREAVAEQGYGLDKFVKDKDYRIRGVAKEYVKNNLKTLICHEDPRVRKAVAEYGYGFDKLINDKDEWVCDIVQTYIINKFNNSLVKWYNENPDKRYYDSLHQIFDDQQCSAECVDLLISDNYFLDYILKNTDAESQSDVKQCLIELGCNNITDWMINYPDNVYYTELLKDLPKKAEQITQDFISKINDSKTLTVSNNIEEFFNSAIEENSNLTIYTVDTKIPIIKINKELKDEKTVFIFNVNITNNDNFKSIVTTKDQLNKLIEQTINALNIYPQFASYIEDLENCL